MEQKKKKNIKWNTQKREYQMECKFFCRNVIDL